MISGQKLKQEMQILLGNRVPKSVDAEVLAERLNDAGKSNGVEQSAYGYQMWTMEHGGLSAIYRGQQMSSQNMADYANAARKYKEDMPVLLVNASQYVDRVFNTIQEPSLCMPRLEGMTFPYVLYVLFAAVDQKDIVEQYRIQAQEHMKRYPSTFDLLPDTYKAIGEELKRDADA